MKKGFQHWLDSISERCSGRITQGAALSGISLVPHLDSVTIQDCKNNQSYQRQNEGKDNLTRFPSVPSFRNLAPWA